MNNHRIFFVNNHLSLHLLFMSCHISYIHSQFIYSVFCKCLTTFFSHLSRLIRLSYPPLCDLCFFFSSGDIFLRNMCLHNLKYIFLFCQIVHFNRFTGDHIILHSLYSCLRNIPVNTDLICHYRFISCNIFHNERYRNSFPILRFLFYPKFFRFFIAFSDYFFSCFTDNFRNLTSI